MNINFTGIKNIGYETRTYRQLVPESINSREFSEEEQEHFINLELTDDYNGNDLSEYKRIIRTTDLQNYTNPVNPKFLNIMISKDVVKDNIGSQKNYQIWINDSTNELEIKDQNLPMISFIAKILTKISNTPENQFIINKDYINGDDAKIAIVMNENFEDTYKNYYPQKIKQVHSPNNVKNGAAKMNEAIKDMMFDYFC